jgi:7,8-dihydropterin-6-yl-methyl-4-(beta-D-ribofuranosyl)aminobenzene 5'-phosphate synthase
VQKRITLTYLSDNKNNSGLDSEWGLSVLIDMPSGSWLWDTGQSDIFLRNARKLGLNLDTLNGVAISHGHYDHGGGISALFRETGYNGSIYGHSGCQRERWHVSTQKVEEIGIPGIVKNFKRVQSVEKLSEELTLLTDIPRVSGNFEAVQNFYFDKQGTQPDHVEDDAFLLIDTASGPVVQLGCCHSGLANSLACLKERTGVSRIHTLLGGLHLYNAGEEEMEQAVATIETFDIQNIYPCHCSGDAAAAYLKKRLNCFVGETGTGFSISF